MASEAEKNVAAGIINPDVAKYIPTDIREFSKDKTRPTFERQGAYAGSYSVEDGAMIVAAQNKEFAEIRRLLELLLAESQKQTLLLQSMSGASIED